MKIKSTIPFKVSGGYLFLALILVCIIALIYGNTRALSQLESAEREFTQRRGLVDSLMLCFLEANNHERVIYMGVDDWKAYNDAIHRTQNLAERLKQAYDANPKIDTLQVLLEEIHRNTLLIEENKDKAASDNYYKQKIKKLQEGHDSILVQARSQRKETETVYQVVKNKRGFFSRLADAFKKQRVDTIEVQKKAIADSTHQSIDVTKHIAGELSRIKDEEMEWKRRQEAKMEEWAREQQLAGMQMTEKIQLLLNEIREDEHHRLQQIMDEDLRSRQNIFLTVIGLGILSLLISCILLHQIWKDHLREINYRNSLIRAKAETEKLTMTITHDIKAPIASIAGFAELMSDSLSSKEDEKQVRPRIAGHLRNIIESANYLLHLVKTLSEFHKIESGKAIVNSGVYDFYGLISTCVESIRPMAKSKALIVEEKADGNSGDLMCIGDAPRLRQIVENVLSNAVKYTDEGKISISVQVVSQHAEIRISDTGRGMDSEECNQIFNAFHRLGNVSGVDGVGLGLAITKELVQLLKGEIRVESEKGVGSTFLIKLPLEISRSTNVPVRNEKSNMQHIAAKSESKRRILIVDDNQLQIMLLKEMIERLSSSIKEFDITAFTSISEATKYYQQYKPEICFLDIEMPEMNGVEWLTLHHSKQTQFIAMTAHDSSIEPQLKTVGFDACLFKPIDKQELAKVLGISMELKESMQNTEEDWNFSGLVAFAEGDKDAEDIILRQFSNDLSEYIVAIRKAIEEGNKSAVAQIAHKCLPTMQLIKMKNQTQLLRLTPEQWGGLSDTEYSYCCEVVEQELSEIHKALNQYLSTENP